MTKYIITDDSDRYCRICEDTTSRDHWLTPDIFIDHTRSVEISDEDYTLLQTGARDLTSMDPLNTTLIDPGWTDSMILDWTEEQIKNNLNKLIKNLEGAVNDTKNPPSGWTTNLAALKAIDISSLSFPIKGRNWGDCLIKNDIQVPSSMEF